MSTSIDNVNLAIRNLVRFVMNMPDGSVRPSDQLAPAGAQTREFATVKIISVHDVGRSEAYEPIPDVTEAVTYDLETGSEIVASINFYRSPAKNPVGIATYSNSAFDRAQRLGRLLWAEPNVVLQDQMGIGILSSTPARNLTGVVDATWESRGQIDVTFGIVNQELFQVATIASVELAVTAQTSSGSEQFTIEVST